MPSTSLNKTQSSVFLNKSGIVLVQGSVVIPSSSDDSSVTTTTDTDYLGPVGVVLDPGGIGIDERGSVAFSGYVPKINLTNTATRTQGIVVGSVTGQGTAITGYYNAFGFALTAGSTPQAFLFDRPSSELSLSLSGLAAGDLLRYTGSAWANVPGDVSVRLIKSGTQAVGPASTVTVTWETEEYDTSGMHDGVNPERITFPVAGKYLIIAGVNYDANSVVAATIRANGTTELSRQAQGNSGVTEGVLVSTIKNFAATEYVEIRFYAGNNGNIVVANTHFEASLIART